MVARRTTTVSQNPIAKASARVLSLVRQIAAVRVRITNLTQAVDRLTTQESALLAKEQAIEASRKSQREKAQAEVNPPTVQSVDIRALLAVASRVKSREQRVRNVRTVPAPEGGLAVVGYVIDESGKRVQLRGFEIWQDDDGGERTFYWSLKPVIDGFNPSVVYESHYSSPRPPDEHMIVSWEDEKDAERRKLKEEREQQKEKRRAENVEKKKRELEREKTKLQDELEAAEKRLKQLERKLKKAREEWARLEREELDRLEREERARAEAKAKAKKRKPKTKAKLKTKPKVKAKPKKLTKAQKRSLASKKGWKTRRENEARRVRARVKSKPPKKVNPKKSRAVKKTRSRRS